LGNQARYLVRIDDTAGAAASNTIKRNWRAEPHIVDVNTGKEYFIRILDGKLSLYEQVGDTEVLIDGIIMLNGYLHNGKLVYNSASTVDIGEGGIANIVRDVGNTYTIEWTGALTADITTAGAGGLDTGSEASDTWYAVFVIADSSEVNSPDVLLSLSATAPTMPGGYDVFRRLGWVRNNASSDIIPFFQSAVGGYRRIIYTDNISNRAILIAGPSVGFASVSAAAYVPTTARTLAMQGKESGTTFTILYRGAAEPISGILIGNEMTYDSFPCTATQTIGYAHLSVGGITDIWVLGYLDTL